MPIERPSALTLVNRVLAGLDAEMARSGKRALYERLRPALAGDVGAPPDPVVAAELGLSVDALKMAAHRPRARHTERPREEIARTVADPSEMHAEIRDLLAMLGG